MRGAYQMDDASTAHVVISPEVFLTLKRLKTEFEEVIETIEILNTPQTRPFLLNWYPDFFVYIRQPSFPTFRSQA